MKQRYTPWLIGLLTCAGLATNSSAATFEYIGTVTVATAAFVPLTPVGTPFDMVYVVDDDAVSSGLVGPDDFQSINMSLGNICFTTDSVSNCQIPASTYIGITSIDAAALTYDTGIPTGGFLDLVALLPADPIFFIDIDFSAGTFLVEVPFAGFASGTMAFVPVPAAVWFFGSAILGLGAFFTGHCAR